MLGANNQFLERAVTSEYICQTQPRLQPEHPAETRSAKVRVDQQHIRIVAKRKSAGDIDRADGLAVGRVGAGDQQRLWMFRVLHDPGADDSVLLTRAGVDRSVPGDRYGI